MNVRRSISEILFDVNTDEQKFEIANIRVVLENPIVGDLELGSVRELELKLVLCNRVDQNESQLGSFTRSQP